jgi:phosphate transport system protein
VDLRFVAAVMKINNDLERMGDSAVNIAQAVQILNNDPPPQIPCRSSPALEALSADGPGEPRQLRSGKHRAGAGDLRSGRSGGRLYEEIFRELLHFMIEDPQVVSRALQLLLVARNVERIADHATNISEDVIYYVEGRDIRHTDG